MSILCQSFSANFSLRVVLELLMLHFSVAFYHSNNNNSVVLVNVAGKEFTSCDCGDIRVIGSIDFSLHK